MKRSLCAVSRRLAIASLVAWSSQLAASVPSTETKLTPADASYFRNFGSSVAIDGDTAVVGVPLDSFLGPDGRAVYVFIKNGSTWEQQAKLVASDPTDSSEFGYAVALSSDTLVVGAHLDSAAGANAGAVYVFTRSGAVWSQQAKLTPTDAGADKQFGAAVTIEGDTVAVGAIGDSEAVFNAGAVYIFTRSGTAWSQQAKLFSIDPRSGNLFGFSVALDGGTLAVGSPFDEDFGVTDAGTVYVFTGSGSVWTQQSEQLATSPQEDALLGWSVAISGDTIIAGAPQDNSAADFAGSAYVFVRSGGTWTQQAKLVADDAAMFESFGYSVAISGNTAAVGSAFDSTFAMFAGSAYTFTRSGTVWTQSAEFSATDVLDSDEFGYTVAMDGGNILVGAPFSGGLDDGAAYIYSSSNSAPVADAQSVTTSEDTVASITLTGSDADGDALTFSVLSGPTRGTLGGTAPNLTYTPNPNENGSDSFTFKANDGSLDSAVATVSITITPVNDAPVANGQSVTTPEDTAAAITLSGSDVESSPLTFVVVASPTKGTLSGAAPNLIYTPNLNENGPDSFTFKVNDGSLDSSVATVAITISPVNDAPVANGQSVTVGEDMDVNITLTGSDVEAGPLAFTVLSGPEHGSLSGTAPNLVYAPGANFNGSDSFTFKANDGELDSAPATVLITVTPVNDAPTISEILDQTTPKRTPIGPIEFTVGDVDNAADVLSVSATSDNPTLVPDSNIVLGGSGANRTVTVTPADRLVGTAIITITVSDGTATGSSSFTLTVTHSNRPPKADATASVTQVISPNNLDAPVHLDGSRSSDPDGDVLTYTWYADGNLTAPVGTGVVGTPRLSIGTHEILLRVSDGEDSADAGIQVRVMTAAEATETLLQHARSLDIPKNKEKELLETLKNAIKHFEQGHMEAGAKQLDHFEKILQSKDGRKMDPIAVAALIAEAEGIIVAVTGG